MLAKVLSKDSLCHLQSHQKLLISRSLFIPSGVEAADDSRHGHTRGAVLGVDVTSIVGIDTGNELCIHHRKCPFRICSVGTKLGTILLPEQATGGIRDAVGTSAVTTELVVIEITAADVVDDNIVCDILRHLEGASKDDVVPLPC